MRERSRTYTNLSVNKETSNDANVNHYYIFNKLIKRKIKILLGKKNRKSSSIG
jgi:hypothetical protein